MTLLHALMLLHTASTLFMTGLIWFVQIVHYPLMARVGSDSWKAYQEQHMRRTTWVVAPAMLIEAASAILIAVIVTVSARSSVSTDVVALSWIGAGLLLVIWISTATLQVPAHQRLLRAFEAETHSRLVRSNWIRTAAWSMRAVIAIWLLQAAESVMRSA